VTLVIAARNEALHLGAKLDNIAELDYPHEKLKVIVASDGSTDASARVVEEHADARTQFLDLPRKGKCATLNAAIAAAHNEILVFSDANSIYRDDALRQLVSPFADPDVGGVAGNQIYLGTSDAEGVLTGERQYWDLDRVLKQSQSDAGSAIGGTGAIYAVRRPLLREIPDGVSDDFFNTLGVVSAGKRLIFAPDAVAYERVSDSAHDEYARKVRVMVRGLRCVWVKRSLLNPVRHGFFSVQLFSHKVLARAMALPLVVAAASAILLAPRRRFYKLAALSQGIFYVLAMIGLAWRRSTSTSVRLFALPAYFCLVNAASVHAFWRLIRGDKGERWEPRR
jgi:cellulose synthase/poly-beta-1,6-N-acetylglucosamine synthase-like glycosyltransferase